MRQCVSDAQTMFDATDGCRFVTNTVSDNCYTVSMSQYGLLLSVLSSLDLKSAIPLASLPFFPSLPWLRFLLSTATVQITSKLRKSPIQFSWLLVPLSGQNPSSYLSIRGLS